MKIVKKNIVLLIMIPILALTGCASEHDSVNLESNEEYMEFIEKVDDAILGVSLEDIESEIAKEFMNASAEKQSELAMELADDIARANFMGVSNDEIMGLAGTAVKAYPHPLLLNNFATMVLEEWGPEEALYFYTLAAAQEPENPVILTNLANVYLELENYTEAKQYADLAVSASNDYGPAYQVLTTLHLKDENSQLAAETMVKSAKYCFNDISVYHFLSFLEAVSQLDAEVDEYPLNETFINDLYDIAKENTGSFTDVSTDIPESQLTLKPFPQITGPDNLMNSEKYFEDLLTQCYEAENNLSNYYDQYKNVAENILIQIDWGIRSESGEKFPVYSSARQICAVRVLESFYRFKLEQLYIVNQKKIDGLQRQMWSEVDKQQKAYNNRIDELEEEADETSDIALASLLTMDIESIPDYIKEALSISLEAEELRVEKQNTILSILKNYSLNIINACNDYYNEQKQLLEEYWLKCGGLLKYISDYDIYMSLSYAREKTVYDYLTNPIFPVKSMGDSLRAYKELLDQARQDLESFINVYEKYLDMEIPQYEEDEKGSKPGDPDFVPDIEREALTEFKESTDMGSWGFELEEPFFGLATVSVSYDGENLDFEFNSIKGGKKLGINLVDGSTYSHTIQGVTLAGDTKWFTKSGKVSDALNRSGPLGKGANALGKIGFSFSDSQHTGQYIQRNGGKSIIDVGRVYIRESGGTISNFGKSTKVTVTKSMISGVAIKSTTTKYKFFFASFEY